MDGFEREHPLNDESNPGYVAFALEQYDNPSCHSIDEFHQDLARLKYIKRLVYRYCRTGTLDAARLLLNHVTIANNCFPPPSLATLLLWKTRDDAWSAVVTVLRFLHIMPERVIIDGRVFLNTSIDTDPVLWTNLNDLTFDS